jgi:hypothetical protein
MSEVPLYDLDPALWLMLTGLLVAIGPLALGLVAQPSCAAAAALAPAHTGDFVFNL